MCSSPWGHKELDRTEQLNWTEVVAEMDMLRFCIPNQLSSDTDAIGLQPHFCVTSLEVYVLPELF